MLAVIILLLIQFGCEYKTDETFSRYVDQNPESPDLSLNLNFNLNEDTVYIYSSSTIKLSLPNLLNPYPASYNLIPGSFQIILPIIITSPW